MKKYILPLLLVLVISGCSLKSNRNLTSEESVKAPAPVTKVAVFVGFVDYNAEFFQSLKNRLDELGIAVTPVSIQVGEAVSGSSTVKIEEQVANLDPKDYAGLVVVGGKSMEYLSNDETLILTAVKFLNADKVLVLSDEALKVEENLVEGSNTKNFIKSQGESGRALADKLQAWF